MDDTLDKFWFIQVRYLFYFERFVLFFHCVTSNGKKPNRCRNTFKK